MRPGKRAKNSFFDDKKDIERRKQLAQTAMSKLWKIYMKGKS